MKDPLLRHILRQVDLAKAELKAYPPQEFDWHRRARSTVTLLVPWLQDNVDGLKAYVEHVMNSPHDAREYAAQILSAVSGLKSNKALLQLSHDLRSSLESESLLISEAGGSVVSKLIESFLIKNSAEWTFESNGASDYPDLFLRNLDYAALPVFRREANMIYGASVKGKQRRPVRIPDGLEIKTCKGNFAVDCHHAHAGLHLVLLFTKTQSQFQVNDIRVGFLRHESYRITKPASPTTTLKASFNGDDFVSLFTPNSA